MPTARVHGLLIEHVGDEIVVYDTDVKDAHCLSPLASVIFDSCDGRSSVESLAALAGQRLGESVDVTSVREALAQLEERDLLAMPPGIGLSRRDVLRRTVVMGAAAAAAAPLITTINAPTASAATSQFCNVPCACCTNQAQCTGSPSCNCTAAAGQEVGSHCKPANAGANACIGQPCP